MRVFLAILCLSIGALPAFAQDDSGPKINDPNLTVQVFVKGIPNSPTTMTFVGNDILVLQKSDGQVRLIRDGVLQPDPVLDVSVASTGECGMLGITSIGTAVYIYYTESDADHGKAIANRIYKYELDGEKLVNPVLLKELTAGNIYHCGGAMTSYDGQAYAVIGDNGNYGALQNRAPGNWKNDTSVIMRIDPPGDYYAMGIRNSFGITFDPVTGNMWDAENGDDEYDEINFVPENFNSGWIEIMGPAKNQTQIDSLPKYKNYVYSDPEFSWQKPVAPTGIAFVQSDKMKEYSDSIFVGDCNNGNLYQFKLNSDRTGLAFRSPELKDDVQNIGESMDEIILGTGFGCMSDVQEGPDGLLYIVSLSSGVIYRILPTALAEQAQKSVLEPMPYWYAVGAMIAMIVAAAGFAYRRKKSTG